MLTTNYLAHFNELPYDLPGDIHEGLCIVIVLWLLSWVLSETWDKFSCAVFMLNKGLRLFLPVFS